MKRNTITRLCSLAAAAVLAVSCIALTGCGSSASSAASSTASTAASAAAAGDNSCGENVTWTLADGTLTISGTGRMTNFTSDSPAPWADQADQITNVEVEGTVTSIGAVAFKGCTNLTTVNIADWCLQRLHCPHRYHHPRERGLHQDRRLQGLQRPDQCYHP